MEAKKKPDKTRKPDRPKADEQVIRNNSTWPMLDREVMEELARNIQRNRNKPGSIPYPFNRD